MPPWLRRGEDCTIKQVEQELDWLAYALSEHGFTKGDVSEILSAIQWTVGSNKGDHSTRQWIGIIDFCRLLLRIGDEQSSSSSSSFPSKPSSSHMVHPEQDCNEKDNDEVRRGVTTAGERDGSGGFVTKQVLLASILHYSECVTARQEGVYQKIHKAISMEDYNKDEEDDGSEESTRTKTSPSFTSSKCKLFCEAEVQGDSRKSPPTWLSLDPPTSNNPIHDHVHDWQTEESFPGQLQISGPLHDEQSITSLPDIFSSDVQRLARGAARIKRAEILAEVVMNDRHPRALSKAEYNDLRDMLLSIMEDWRALAIRCVACLYRLEGIVHQGYRTGTAAEYLSRSAPSIQVARESMRVYANLAQRLGMHRLKSQLEAAAFQILYPRQYSAVSTLYRQRGESMKAVAHYLKTQISKMLQEDPSLMAQLQDIQVSARVKEPYSFWRKLLKKRLEKQQSSGAIESSIVSTSPSSELSIIEVHDGVALRVILKARKWAAMETSKTTQARERMLCYYVHRLIRRRWPALDESRIKDYIANPKPNGYQSLHYTSSVIRNNQEFAFEVQVRSEEMHRRAEFGVAAHWDYKLGIPNKEDGFEEALPISPVLASPERLLPPSMVEAEEKIISGPKSKRSPIGTRNFKEAGENAYIEALATAKRSLVRSNVYVFLAGSSEATEEGKLLSLPAGALVGDLVTNLRQDPSSSFPDDGAEFQVWRNGRLAGLEEPLANGDVVLLARKASHWIEGSSSACCLQ